MKKVSEKIVITWVIVGVLGGAILGSLYGTIRVLYFEQSETGRYAVYERCIQDRQLSGSDGPEYACDQYEDTAVPLGKRLKNQMWHYALIWGLIGFGPGAIIGSSIWQKRVEKSRWE
jgi:phosphate/sulfate permease